MHTTTNIFLWMSKCSPPEVFLRKVVLKIWTKFIGEHPCRKVISIKLQRTFTEIALRHRCSPVNLLHIIRTPFLEEHLSRAVSGYRILQLFCHNVEKARDIKCIGTEFFLISET